MAQMDSYGRHEVLHMAAFLMRAIDQELIEHEQIRANPAWNALAEQASEALFALYQAIGQGHLDDGPAA